MLQKLGEIIRENAFKQKKKNPRLKFNPGLVLIDPRTTGPSNLQTIFFVRQLW